MLTTPGLTSSKLCERAFEADQGWAWCTLCLKGIHPTIQPDKVAVNLERDARQIHLAAGEDDKRT